MAAMFSKQNVYKQLIIGLVLMCLSFATSAQITKNVQDSVISIATVDVAYSYQVPGGDMMKRFGANSALGIGVNYKTDRNWMWGVNANFMFGNLLKEDSILDGLKTESGYIITNVGTYAEVYAYERGYNVTANIGKLIPLGKPNKNSGLIISVGGGFINHKIRIEVAENNVYALSKEYKTGYDRKTNGLLLTEFIGYRYMGNQRLINFFAGFEFMQGFTKGRRPYQFDLEGPDNSPRMDLLYGFRFGWTLPLYRRDPGVYYYN